MSTDSYQRNEIIRGLGMISFQLWVLLFFVFMHSWSDGYVSRGGNAIRYEVCRTFWNNWECVR